ncbi:uncharacterized protein LOC127242070 [Andrographis paniculata]|uniref:uncharacterized protein LOC127242070 n=1 Tax=Andrographis paniculata TaxID=175694 RepID=UPI0021E6F4DB|nr:uncharacterized protein LOC127242070 [Andrographis paniculata]
MTMMTTRTIKNKKKPSKKIGGSCKRHSYHNQTSGVCAVCLAERLEKLANGKSSKPGPRGYYSSSSSSLSSSSYISYSSSSCSSPGEWGMSFSSSSSRVFKGIAPRELLVKCRSTVASMRRRKIKNDDDDEKKNSQESKLGFWSKLVKKKKNKGLIHSRSVRN